MAFLDHVVGPSRKMTSNPLITKDVSENDNNSSNEDTKGQPAQQPLNNDDFIEFISQKKTKKTAAESVDTSMVEYLIVATEKRKYDEAEDSMLTFFRSLLPDAKQLSNKRKRQFKTSVMDNFYDEEFEDFAPPSRPVSPTSSAGSTYPCGLPMEYGRDQSYTTTGKDQDK